MKKMKRIIFLVLIMNVLALWNVNASEVLSHSDKSVMTESLPVLRVTMNGSFTPQMSYVNGSMELTDVDGSVVSLRAKFKTRGATASQYMMKPSFNMKLRTSDYSQEQDSALLGMRSCSSWILDGMAIDRICMRNRVAFDIWNEFSHLPYETNFDSRNGTEGRFVEVYVNNTYYGIYCMSDRINRKLLDLKKVKENDDHSLTIRGVIYKSGTQDILNQNERCFNSDSTACVVEWHNAWELTFPEDLGGLRSWNPLLEAFENGKTANFVKKYFYLENLADYQIHVMALCIADNWGNKNHFLSIRNIQKEINDTDVAEASKRKFVMTPWDLDTSLGGAYDGSFYNGNYTDWPVATIDNNPPYPIFPVSQDAQYKTILRNRWLVARQGSFSPASVNAKLERYRDLFINSGAWQRMVDHFNSKSSKPCYVTDLATEISLIEAWYATRFSEMDRYFSVTGLDEVSEESGDETLYDLLGRKVRTENPSPGTYIRGGKVIMIVK